MVCHVPDLGIKELKNLLTEAGVSFAGATEKEDLVRLMTKSKAQAAVQKDAGRGFPAASLPLCAPCPLPLRGPQNHETLIASKSLK